MATVAVMILVAIGIGIGVMLAGGASGGVSASTSPTRATPVAAAPASASTRRRPAMDRPRPTEARLIEVHRIECTTHLHQVGQALGLYAKEHGGKFPPDLGTLVTEYTIISECFVCSNAGTVIPNEKNHTRAQRAAWVNANSDYIYVPGLTTAATANAVLAYEYDENEYGDGVNVLFNDLRVEFLQLSAAHKLIAESAAATAADRGK